jgi:hypothetical protein
MIAVFTIIPVAISLSYFKQDQSHLVQDQTHLPQSVFIILILVMIALLLNFYKLKVKADSSFMQIIFGIGLLNFKIRPKKILKLEAVETPWYYGFGIRVMPTGMLYNVHGLKAVQITYLEAKNPDLERIKTVTIGTRDAHNLINYLKSEYPVN